MDQRATTIALAAALLAYANADAWICGRRPPAVLNVVNLRHLAVLGGALLWAGVERVSRPEMGLGAAGAGRSLGWGLLLAAAVSGPIWVCRSRLRGLTCAPSLADHAGARARRWAVFLGQLVLSTAVVEEFAFRGLLHAKLTRLLGVQPALIVGSGLFAAWHAVVLWHNLPRLPASTPLHVVLYLGAMLGMFIVGLSFGTLRHRTGHVAGGIVVHALVLIVGHLALATRPVEDSAPTAA